jgi:hypothetical protein
MAIHEADQEAELIDSQPCPAALLISSSIDARLLMHHMRLTSLTGIVFIAVSGNDERIVRD